jgi:hypothetical protein
MQILPFTYLLPVLRARLNEKFDRGAEDRAFLVESYINAGAACKGTPLRGFGNVEAAHCSQPVVEAS